MNDAKRPGDGNDQPMDPEWAAAVFRIRSEVDRYKDVDFRKLAEDAHRQLMKERYPPRPSFVGRLQAVFRRQ